MMIPDNIHSDDAFRAAGALIDDDTPNFTPPTIDGHVMSTGLDPRDYDRVPCGANATEFPDELLIPESDIKDAFEHYVNSQGTLYDLRKRVNGYLNSLDQNGYGLCWQFSTVKSYMYVRELAGLPRIPLSWWWIAGKINRWADRGGYCEASANYLVKHGIPTFDLCPKYSKQYDTPEAEADAATRKMPEYWDTSADKANRFVTF